MLVRINPGSDEPIYHQIASSITRQIDRGSLKPDDRLPSARTLSSSLDVNLHTVLKAYALLQERGYVEMKRGRGGVLVSQRPSLERGVKQLVESAKREGMTRSQLTELIGRKWS